MTKFYMKLLAVFVAAILGANASFANTRVDPVILEAVDGERIIGFTYISRHTKEDAPIAVLMHPMAASNLYWLAGDNPMSGDDLTADLLARGYRIVALDARGHGSRTGDKSPMAFLQNAREGDGKAYRAMITGTIEDYKLLLDTMLEKHPEAKGVLAMGYSMGAQMATLFAAQDKRVTHLVTMVPPAVTNVPELAPIKFAPSVTIPWLLLTADKDQFATKEQNTALANAAGTTPEVRTFDSKHLLPGDYVNSVSNWLNGLN